MSRTISPLPQPLSHWERGAGTPEFFGFLPLLPLGEGGWGGEGDFGLCQCHSDLTMTPLTYDLLRLLATDLAGYGYADALSLYDKLLQNSGHVEFSSSEITVFMKKKRTLPTLMAAMEKFQGISLTTHQHKTLRFCADNIS